ncbi:hypothetical protein BCR39DRAFT_558163 [Naematelia encephala]|uniref:Transcription elongation factor Eaf N-terminal domain-containing protein n=1 Tax=Naematelia encephala TaxID=71784 RepID=A0A1Y2B9D6_9TREE|nr:hypothetical protein BCR39DRAFT_558163 [Naematelia encephala]
MSTSSLPSSGSFPVDTSALFGKKSKSKDEVISFRYAFKPASITSATPAVLTTESGSRRLIYEMQNGSRQVFDVREETCKPRECVLIYNEVDQTFSLRALPTTLHLTLNRSLSTATRPAGPPSIASSSSSGSVPLSKRKHTDISESSNTTAKIEAESETAHRPKKARPSQVRPAAPTPQKVSRKTLPATSTTTSSSAIKAKESKSVGGKKGQTKQPVGKYKSAEIIEDSDEEAGDLTIMDKDKDKDKEEIGVGDEDVGVGVGGDGDEVEEEEDEDDFARLLGDEMAADEAAADDDSDDEDEEDDEEDMGLGGARYISRKQTAPQEDLNGDSEWL